MLKDFSPRILALSALLFFLSSHCGTPNVLAQLRRTTTQAEQIVLSTTVTDKKGNLITGLQRESFRASIDKKPADIIEFRAEDVPLSVGIIVDVSGSVNPLSSTREKKTLINGLREGLRTFMETSNQSNEYFLMAFNKRPQMLLDWTSDSKAIGNTLALLQPDGNTALYDACYLALDKVRHGRNAKSVLLLITDGADNISSFSFKDVREELRNTRVLLYTVGITNSVLDGSNLAIEGQRILDELSAISGGIFYHKRGGKPLTVSDATTIFAGIATELRQHYSIVIAPHSTSDDFKWHKIKVEVASTDKVPLKAKNLLVRTREGFYLNHR